mmetsp:Transcript_15093/g.57327  ORF Transcript_15093/g.57327 Transcript_15093/m.57327 type:complete len:213 (+) Transcript_15093:324-962(+)
MTSPVTTLRQTPSSCSSEIPSHVLMPHASKAALFSSSLSGTAGFASRPNSALQRVWRLVPAGVVALVVLWNSLSTSGRRLLCLLEPAAASHVIEKCCTGCSAGCLTRSRYAAPGSSTAARLLPWNTTASLKFRASASKTTSCVRFSKNKRKVCSPPSGERSESAVVVVVVVVVVVANAGRSAAPASVSSAVSRASSPDDRSSCTASWQLQAA